MSELEDGFVTPPARDSPTNSYARTPMKTPTSASAVFSRSCKSFPISPIVSPGIGSFSDVFRCTGGQPIKQSQTGSPLQSAPTLEINSLLNLIQMEDKSPGQTPTGVPEAILDLLSNDDRYSMEYEEIQHYGDINSGREVGIARNVSDERIYQITSISMSGDTNIIDIPEVAALSGSNSSSTPRYFAVWKDPNCIRIQTEIIATTLTLESCTPDDLSLLNLRLLVVSMLDALADAHSRNISHGGIVPSSVSILHADLPKYPLTRYKLCSWQSASLNASSEMLAADVSALAKVFTRFSENTTDDDLNNFLKFLPEMTAIEGLKTFRSNLCGTPQEP